MRVTLIMVFLLLPAANMARAQLLERPTQDDGPVFSLPKPETPKDDLKPDKLALALQYFDRCVKDLYPNNSDEARGDFCMCSADMARNTLSEEELAYLATGVNNDHIRYFDPQEFAAKLDKTVNIPCAHLIIQDIERSNCLASDKIQHFFVTQDAYEVMCDCVASSIGDFVRDFGTDIIAAVRKRYLNSSADPAAAIRQWKDYKVELGNVTRECLNTYGHR